MSSFASVRIAYSEEQSLISFWKSTDYGITALGILALNVLKTLNRNISSFEITAYSFPLEVQSVLLFGMVSFIFS